jgi:sugar lactone lactonase YvrE
LLSVAAAASNPLEGIMSSQSRGALAIHLSAPACMLALLLSHVALAQAPSFVAEWGTYGTGDGQFQIPVGVAVDGAGNVYVAESGGSRIQKFTNTGQYVTQWPAFHPQGIAVDADGNVYATVGNQGLAKFSSTGVLLAQWGVLGSGLAVDHNGVIYVPQNAWWTIARLSTAGASLPTWSDSDSPNGVAADANGSVFIVDTDPPKVRKLASDGTLLKTWGALGTGDGQFNEPTRAAVDASGNVYVVDYGNNRIEYFSNDGVYEGQWGGTGSGPGQFAGPIGIAVDAEGFVYVADANNNRIQKFGPLPTRTNSGSWGRLKNLYR